MSFALRRLPLPVPNRRDLLALPLVIALFFIVSHAGHQMTVPYRLGQGIPISLSPTALPEYGLYTVLRMLAALVVSFMFTLGYAWLAAHNRYAERLLVPVLDVLQSVPILGYLSITVTGFMALFPGSLVGVQLAVIFAVFTSQAWNMTFSLYQSLKTVPRDLQEAATLYRLNAWQRFWKLELPFAMPGLLWNTMMSMSGGWFFVVASEAITVANQTVTVPGIGSYIARAIAAKDLGAIGWAIAAMIVIILLYDTLMFRPIVAWADKFKFEMTSSGEAPRSAVLDYLRRTRVLRLLAVIPAALWDLTVRLSPRVEPKAPPPAARRRWGDGLFYAAVAVFAVWAVVRLVQVLPRDFGWPLVFHVLGLGLITGFKVFVLVGLSALIWVPIGVWIGLRPRWAQAVQPLAQFLAAFPANLLFPLVVVAIVRWHLDVDVFTAPLMILGSMWYILFSVVGAASAIPSDMREAAQNLGLRGWLLWKRLYLPGVFPGFVTGAITASGGAWNASIVAEVVSWGDKTLVATGLGAFISQATAQGRSAQIALGVGVMSLYVILVNRLFWHRLYELSVRRVRLD
ncbi:MAG: ABC transporter permease subunit [Betaproteobacteria bacterium]|nr:ABC transporter permease subunit [Betaproteobacteria bacterium]MDE2122809.1 ABC transporter permease subunit [Betaproteobacteria bacterium]MDE2186476.1 ABC transporter permease subunit [Betaproteobacteria bacterium]MDE2324433.1 ABC transporter permease subunit [Betaproteobacteria bacterium]